MKTLSQYSEELSGLLLSFDPGETEQLLEIQTVLLEISAELVDWHMLSTMSMALSSDLDPLYRGEPFDPVRDLFFKGFDLLQRGIHYAENREAKSDKSDWDELVGRDLTAYFSNRQWEIPPAGEEQPDSGSPALDSLDIEIVDEQPSGKDATGDHGGLEEIVNSEFFETFITENRNRLIRAVEIILDLDESVETEPELINELFRIFHTMKGEAGFIGLSKVASMTHELETMLDSVRNGEVPYGESHTEALLYGEDLIKEHFLCLEENQLDDYENKSLDRLNDLIRQTVPAGHVQLGEVLEEQGSINHDDALQIATIQESRSFSRRYGEVAEEEGFASSEEVSQSVEIQRERNSSKKELKKKDSFISIRSSHILEMTTMIQELWIAENQIDDEIINPIKKITSQLQHLAMGFLTEEINSLYIKLRRIVRDTAKKAGKKIDVVFQGSEFEIDRKLVEALEEPLMHIIRNSIDHGIEEGAGRAAAGKSEMGSIRVGTARRGNRVVISVRDDGKGLNREKILSKALERNLITEDEASKISPEKVFELITVPGFSTAEKVSELSGRGVGMDAVLAMIESHHGRLEIHSEEGSYTQFDLVFPLNVAIVDGMVLRSGKDIFIVPISEIIECIQISPDSVETVKGDIRVLRLRGEVIPVINLEKVFLDRGKRTLDDIKAAVIVSAHKNKYVFLVSDILEKTEVAIKPLGKKFSTLRGISAGTVFSGGAIGFILDVEQIVEETALNRIEGV